MIKIIVLIFVFSVFIVGYSFTYKNENKSAAFSLAIKVKNLRNSKGIVQFTLYNKDGSIPDENYENYYKILKGEIVNGSYLFNKVFK